MRRKANLVATGAALSVICVHLRQPDCTGQLTAPNHCWLPCLPVRRSEEQRLEVSRALIDFQMETNEARQEWANTK